MTNIVTVDYLLNLLQKLHDAGGGAMVIKCGDGFLHEDEIAVKYMAEEVQFRGHLYNVSIAQKVKEFCKDIETATNKFYDVNDESED